MRWLWYGALAAVMKGILRVSGRAKEATASEARRPAGSWYLHLKRTGWRPFFLPFLSPEVRASRIEMQERRLAAGASTHQLETWRRAAAKRLRMTRR